MSLRMYFHGPIMWTLWFSQFFTCSRFIICSCANECYVIIFICSLLVGVDSVADTWNWNLNKLMLHFVECTQLFSNYSPECWKWHFRPFQFQNFLGDLHKRRGLTPGLLIYSVTLFKPAGYMYFNNNIIVIETPDT